MPTFKARVVYGLLPKLEVILLGNPADGDINTGMTASLQVGTQSEIGHWEIVEIQRMDFINDADNHKFLGLVLRCKDEQDFNLLKSLRVYDETLLIKGE